MIELKNYRLYLLENEIAKNTIKNYLNTLYQLDQFLRGNGLGLDKESMILFKAHLQEIEWRPGIKYKLSTLNQKITAINIYFNWIDRHDLTVKNLKTQTVEHRAIFNQKEYRRLLGNATSEEMRLFMLTIANTGLRISETCRLTVMDLDKRSLLVNNKGKIRTIAIPVWVKKQLKYYCGAAEIDGVIFDKSQSHYREELKVVAGKAKVNKEKVFPHAFRHYFSKNFLSSGGDSATLQQMLGHENISTTTIYTKYSSDELAEIFSKIKND